MNAQVYAGYSFLMQYVTLKNTDIQIIPDFLSTQSRMEVSGELFFRVGTLLASGTSAVWHFLKLIWKDKNDAAVRLDTEEKAAAQQ